MADDKNSMYRILFVLVIIISTVILISSFTESSIVSASPNHLGEITEYGLGVNNDAIVNCRYGATPVFDNKEEQMKVIPRLGVGWYLTFDPYPPSPGPSNEADFAHMIGVQQLKNAFTYLPGYEFQPSLNTVLAQYIRNNPGDLWIIGNEIDRGPNPGETNPANRGQGDTFPEVYAKAYHEAYRFIKHNDPTAQVAISGLVEVTPGRLQYLNKVWNTYLKEYKVPMPVDIWTMHLYVLPEVEPDGLTPNGIANVALGTDPSLGKRSSDGNFQACESPDVYCYAEHDDLSVFAEQVLTMRQWMKAHGQKEKPLVLSEYSILFPFEDDGDTCFLQDEYGNCFTPIRVSEFMTKTMDYLNNATDPTLGYSLDSDRLIQQSMWFSIYNTAEGNSSNLVENDLFTFTKMGQTFRDYVFNENAYQNLLADQTEQIIGITGPDGTAKVNISAAFRNNGNTKIEPPFAATFYEDAGLSKPIGTVNISADILGCATRPYVASIAWSGLSKGVHDYWYLLDSGEDIGEEPPGNGDNVGIGRVIVMTDSVFLPMIMR